MALELQYELQQKVQSDNLGIRASNRLAMSNLKTQEGIKSAEQDVGEGKDAFSVRMSGKQA
jgi:RIO-like serine/threonine protein kinase